MSELLTRSEKLSPGPLLLFVSLLSPLSFGLAFLVAGIAYWSGASSATQAAWAVPFFVGSMIFLFVISFLFARRIGQHPLKWAAGGMVTIGISTAGLVLWWMHRPESGVAKRTRLWAWGGAAVVIAAIAVIGRGMEQSGRSADRLPIIHITTPDGTVPIKKCSKCGREVSVLYKAGDRCPHCGARWSYETE
ncbi:MAG: hypothetical protein JXL80_13570 [Planctomycetes bacterium]|nr:hypothetical protein [Planctomycetota bacterium]